MAKATKKTGKTASAVPTTVEVRYVVPFPEIKPPMLNIDEMKKAATSFSEKYRGLVVTRENFADGKTACAEQKKVIDALTALKTELNRRAKEIVAPAIKGIDEVLEIVRPTYTELHDGLASIKGAMDKEKAQRMVEHGTSAVKEKYPELTAAAEHIKAFVAAKCAEKKNGWLVKSWTEEAIFAEIDKEVERMGAAMDFINRHVKGKPVDVVRVAKTALVNNGFNEVVALEAMDKYERTLGEQRRMNIVRSGGDPDARPAPKPADKVPVSDPITPNTRMMTATVKFTASVEDMRKLVAVIKAAGISYEVLEQKFIEQAN